MSYTITQQATSPNTAYTRLIYTVSGSTKSSEPQFSYLVDVYESGSSSRVARLVQQVNPAGVSIFDPSRIFQGELSQDESWKISSVTPFNSSSKTFTLEFGEQYGTSISSSVTVSSSIATNNIEVFRGVVDPNAGYYNWDSASYAVLSNMPATMSMQPDDYGTISLYNNTVVYVSQSFYSTGYFSGNTVLVDSQSYSITDNFSSVPISSSQGWQHVDVAISSSVGLQSYRYEVSNDTCREKVRFAFINKLGAWDYYNNYNPVRQSISVKREQYTAPRVDYSSLTSTYDISRRGLSDYHNSTNDSFVVDTDYLDKTNANWLEELIESPSVYIQRNGEFIPIVINDSNYIANTNQARQKLFKYSITFTPSNQPFGVWIPEYTSASNAYVVKEAFDPTSGSALTSQIFAWYDWTDNSSMTIINKTPTEIESKGTYTGSLYHEGFLTDQTILYSGSGYVEINGHNKYDMNEQWGATDAWTVFASSSSWTSIVFAQASSVSGSLDNPRVQFTTLGRTGDEGTLRQKDLMLYRYRNSTEPFFSSSDDLYYTVSQDTANTGISSSYTQFTFNDGGGAVDAQFVYNYSGSTNSPVWESKVMRRDYAASTVDAGRDATDLISVGSIDNIITTELGDGLIVTSGGPLPNPPTRNARGRLKISQILVYTGSLSNSEIDYVWNSFVSSSNIDFGSQVNAVNN